MKTYIVTWELTVEADTAESAAERARKIQLDNSSDATYFCVEELIYKNGRCSTGRPVDVDTADINKAGSV